MAQHRFQLKQELKIIPGVAIGLAVVAFVGLQVLLQWLMHLDHNPPPAPFRFFIGLTLGTIFAVLILLCGYVYRDAKRRGMNAGLWLLVVIFVPNALGFIIYFLMRGELTGRCPKCGATIRPGFNFCPKCNHALAPVCPKCRHAISSTDVYCPYCGSEVAVRA